MFNYISGYIGVVEPQMRFTEHLHALVQILGYSHPEEFFRSGTFVDMFRRMWAFAASICFTSQEALADQCGTYAAKNALSTAPVIPLSRKQRSMLGPERAQETMDAQNRARTTLLDVPRDATDARNRSEDDQGHVCSNKVQ